MWLCEVKPCEFSKGAAPYRDSLTTDDLHFIIIYYLFLYFPLTAYCLSMNLSFRRLDSTQQLTVVYKTTKRSPCLFAESPSCFIRKVKLRRTHWVLFYGRSCMHGKPKPTRQ